MDNPLFLITKGIKAKRKRLGGGGGGGGGYPEGTAPFEVGVMNEGLLPSNHLHASVLLKDSFSYSPNFIPPPPPPPAPPFTTGFMPVYPMVGGVPLNSLGAPEVHIADYVATQLNGETPINDANGSPMQNGFIQTLLATGDAVGFVWRLTCDNQGGAHNTGSVDITIAHNPNNMLITSLNGSTVNATTCSTSLTGNPPTSSNITLEFSPPNVGDIIILEFRLTAGGKGGTYQTGTVNPSGAFNSVQKNGSCYVKILFN